MSSMAPRGKDETDAQYKARQVELGKFNEKMYGEKGTSQPVQPPTLVKEPRRPVQPPTKAPNQALEKIKAVRQRIENVMSPLRAPTKGPMSPKPAPTKGPMPPKPAPTRVKVITDPMQPTAPTAAAPIKKAAGGAAKVRKGMATPDGKIIHAMNKIRGK